MARTLVPRRFPADFRLRPVSVIGTLRRHWSNSAFQNLLGGSPDRAIVDWIAQSLAIDQLKKGHAMKDRTTSVSLDHPNSNPKIKRSDPTNTPVKVQVGGGGGMPPKIALLRSNTK
jgi:hypothetical protein